MTRTKFIPAIFILLLIMSACGASVSSEAEPVPTTIVDVIPTLTPVKIPLTEAEVPRVTLEDAKTALDSGTAVFVDVRSKDAYKAGHIPGALLIQLGEFETNPTKLTLPKDQWIITYCTWLSEHSSARAAFLLLNNGYTNVSTILGGFKAWQDAGYPVEP